MFLMPPSVFSSLSFSRPNFSSSLLGERGLRAGLRDLPSDFRRLIDCRIVLKLVSMPPSQRRA